MTNLIGQEPYELRGANEARIRALETNALPVGVPVPWPAATAPTGWLVCDGSAVPASCPILASLYGANLPDLKGRVIVGFDAGQAEFDSLGETGGAKTHTLTTAQMPSHTHTHNIPAGVLYDVGTGGARAGNSGTLQAQFATLGINSAGSGSAHNNLQPYRVFNYIVRAA